MVDLPASFSAMLADEFIPAAALVGLALPARRPDVLVIVQPFAVGQSFKEPNSGSSDKSADNSGLFVLFCHASSLSRFSRARATSCR